MKRKSKMKSGLIAMALTCALVLALCGGCESVNDIVSSLQGNVGRGNSFEPAGQTRGKLAALTENRAGNTTPKSAASTISDVTQKTTRPVYCVVDLSAGAQASSYPVTWLINPPKGGFNTDEYKTTKLVLRRIDAGTYDMGGYYRKSHSSLDWEYGLYPVTLTRPYFIGIFEVTQKHYELVTGKTAEMNEGPMRPVEGVSWDEIRGASETYNWPEIREVTTYSFVGQLRKRTKLKFDLPTEAQWEIACRAGTTTCYNNGSDEEISMMLLGRYQDDGDDGKGAYDEYGYTVDQSTTVGSYLPNAWGLYDMHGNVKEWCLDWNGRLPNDDWKETYLPSEVTDPVGPSSGKNGYWTRVCRGGMYGNTAKSCDTSARSNVGPEWGKAGVGFRIACNPK